MLARDSDRAEAAEGLEAEAGAAGTTAAVVLLTIEWAAAEMAVAGAEAAGTAAAGAGWQGRIG